MFTNMAKEIKSWCVKRQENSSKSYQCPKHVYGAGKCMHSSTSVFSSGATLPGGKCELSQSEPE